MIIFSTLVATLAAYFVFHQYERLHQQNLQEIAERKSEMLARARAEQTLRESEERFRGLAETATDAIITIGADERIHIFNRAAERIFGYSAEELVGQDIGVLIPEEYEERHRAAIRRYLETGQSTILGKTVELKGRRKGGTVFPLDLSLSVVRVGGQVTFTGIIRDITGRKSAEERIRRETARVEVLARVAARLNAQLDLDAVLNAVCEETARALNVPAAGVALYDETRDLLYLAADFGLSPEYRERWQPVPRAIYDEYAARMGPLIVVASEVQSLPDLPNADLYKALDIRTIVGATMRRNGKLVGGLNVITIGEERHFAEEELALLKGLADQAAQAITNARLYEETFQKSQRLALLYDAGLTINRALDPRVQLEFLFQIAMKALHAERAAFFRYDVARNQVCFELGVGHSDAVQDALRGFRFGVGEERGLVGWVAGKRVPLNVPDITADPRHIAIDPEIRSGLWVPVEREDQLLGVLCMSSTRLNAFTPQDERLLVLFANQVAVALENARLFEETSRRLKQVQALHAIDMAISGSLDLRVTLNVLLEQIASQLGLHAATVLLLDPHTQTLKYAAGRGFRTLTLQHTQLRLGDSYAGRAALERQIVSIPNLMAEPDGLTRAPLLAEEEFVTYYGAPLIVKGQVRGVLEIFQRAPLEPDQGWLDFVQALAAQAAIAIDNAALFNDLQRSNLELTLAYDLTIEGWSHALDLRDRATGGHTERILEMTLRLARAMGMDEGELVQVRRGALLHDIGKIGIPDSILLKPGPLTPQEWEVMRRHPVYAYEMLSPIAFLRPALDIPYCHHEKWDGSGYPRGLKAEEIPRVARIFAVVDVWDALCSDRPYGPALPEDQVLERIRALAGTHFDPQVVEVFLSEVMPELNTVGAFNQTPPPSQSS